MILAPRNIKVSLVNSEEIFKAAVVVGVALYNQSGTIRRCLDSIFVQDLSGRRLAVVILDDQSSDNWELQVSDLLRRPEIIVLKGNCGSPARTRNGILDFVDENFSEAVWVARLDADDCFTCSKSLAAACGRGDELNAGYVLGGNRLMFNNQMIEKENPAIPELLNGQFILSILKKMADGTALNELPSCNLLLRVRRGWRYPDLHSAEDHWLVASLLLNHSNEGAIVAFPFYCDYSLAGNKTISNIFGSEYFLQRQRLFSAASDWYRAGLSEYKILGYGQEGLVRLVDGYLEKSFYLNTVSDIDVDDLKKILNNVSSHLPSPEWCFTQGRWIARYPYQQTEQADNISIAQAREFLIFCLSNNLVCKNIKRENFRITTNGNLFMSDIGRDVTAMRMDYFRDSAARLFGLAALRSADGEFLRRRDERRQEDVLSEISGFNKFYCELILTHAQKQWQKTSCEDPISLSSAEDVTLLIKCCAMDAEFIDHQVRYIVYLLSKPRMFREIQLLIDPYSGPFLRQHSVGDFDLLINKAKMLAEEGIISKFIIAPDSQEELISLNLKWFNLSCASSHTVKGVPVTSQLWGFEQIDSRYVLQCDADILIGRHDLEHDYLTEMIEACSGHDNVLCVAFNIPHPEGTINPYNAPPGEYVPEVRCGLLDLQRFRACRPLPNAMVENGLKLTWYRSLQQYQKLHNCRTLRGGDYRTFYLHPENHWKTSFEFLSVIRDLTAQGNIPDVQLMEWDLKGDVSDWKYPSRYEDIVFLIKGKNTPQEKIKRCFSSLMMQDDQNFGVIVIDDASDVTDISLMQHYLRQIKSRVTLIRRCRNVGRIPNFITGIREICKNSETLVAILDMDDALINTRTVSLLREKWSKGHDIIIGGMFRPDKPAKIYWPEFENVREKWGSNVWAHLRSFRKRLFDQLPDSVLKIDGKWIQECTDYATMIPMVELASSPVFIPEYLYWHERTTIKTPEIGFRHEQLLKMILNKHLVIHKHGVL